jgi:hypothetical protein
MARPRLVITRRIYQEVVASLQTEFDILADNQATDQPWDQQALQQRRRTTCFARLPTKLMHP